MIRLLLGLVLLPTSALVLVAGAGELVGGASSPFWAGLAVSLAVWWRGGSLIRRAYVLGHELTHALAAWSMGAKVHSIHVGEHSGHVDLSESNFIVALAPYCVPLYALLVVGAYRAWVWWKPALTAPGLFLALMGAALAFHWALTAEALWTVRQPDLKAAGGRVFSLSLIVLANGLCVLMLSKALFPQAVDMGRAVTRAYGGTRTFWSRVAEVAHR